MASEDQERVLQDLLNEMYGETAGRKAFLAARHAGKEPWIISELFGVLLDLEHYLGFKPSSAKIRVEDYHPSPGPMGMSRVRFSIYVDNPVTEGIRFRQVNREGLARDQNDVERGPTQTQNGGGGSPSS